MILEGSLVGFGVVEEVDLVLVHLVEISMPFLFQIQRLIQL
jgi:hypothetical protein